MSIIVTAVCDCCSSIQVIDSDNMLYGDSVPVGWIKINASMPVINEDDSATEIMSKIKHLPKDMSQWMAKAASSMDVGYENVITKCQSSLYCDKCHSNGDWIKHFSKLVP